MIIIFSKIMKMALLRGGQMRCQDLIALLSHYHAFVLPYHLKIKIQLCCWLRMLLITMTRRPCAFRQVFSDFLCCCFSPTVIIPTAEYKKCTPSVLLWYCCHNFSLIIAILISSTVLLSHGNNCLNLSSENSSWVASLNFACRYF